MLWSAFVMVRLSVLDGESPVQLFDKEQTNHLVGECHAGKGKHTVASVVDRLGETVGTADEKYHPLVRERALFAQKSGKFY